MDTDRLRLWLGVALGTVGLLVVAAIDLVVIYHWDQSADVVAVVGGLGTLAGTIVGSFLGFHAGAVGKEGSESARRSAEMLNRHLLAALPESTATTIMTEIHQGVRA